MKKTFKILALIVGFISILLIGVYTSIIKLPITQQMHLSDPVDYGNDAVLVQSSDNMFVGKVIKQVGNKSVAGTIPFTQFSVQVISNIKGNLEGNIIVNQTGGYKYGVLHVAEGIEGEDYLLKPGSSYFFSTRRSNKNDWNYLITHSNASKLLSQDKNISLSELQQIANDDFKVKTLIKVIANPPEFPGFKQESLPGA